MKLNKIILSAAPAEALVVALTLALMPTPATWTDSWAGFHMPLVISSIITVFGLNAALLFLLSSRIYKSRLRHIYIAMAIGMTITAIGSMQIPIINALTAWDSPWVTYGFIGLPFLTASIILFVSMRQLGRLVNLKSLLLRYEIAIPITIVVGILVGLLPHAPTTSAPGALAASNVVATFCGMLYGFGATIAFQIRRNIGRHYRQAMLTLGFAIGASAFVSVPIVINTLITGVINGSSPFNLIVEASVPAFEVWAGYTFAKASVKEQDVNSGDIDNILNMVTYAASLASDTKAIDVFLDPVRTVTARVDADKLQPSDVKTLAGVYFSLERYLTTDEPIRSFTKNELRSAMTPALQQQLVTFESNNKGV